MLRCSVESKVSYGDGEVLAGFLWFLPETLGREFDEVDFRRF